MNILRKRRDVIFWMNQINTDNVQGLDGNFFNKAKNDLGLLIADGEAREYRKIYGHDRPDASVSSVDTYDGVHRQGSQF